MARLLLTGLVRVSITDNSSEYTNECTLETDLAHIKQTMELDSEFMLLDFEIVDDTTIADPL